MNKVIATFIEQSEKALLLGIACATVWAAAIETLSLFSEEKMNLADLFLLFIYAEILGMVGAFYNSHKIPVTLPIVIAITALTRMIVLQTKDLNALNIVWESLGILALSGAAYILSLKGKLTKEEE